SAPGLYTPMDIPIGLALIVTLHAADSREDNSWFQSASFALAWALTFLLIAGLFLVNPYITEGQITDHFTHFEVPAVWLIKHSLGEQASDIVSCFIVSVVAIFWYFRRRRLYAAHQPPLRQKGEDTNTTSSKPSAQPALPPV